ncbi:hypothetical protein ACH5RR_035192 [Cinchona calisaya]|uniref:B box-type domain-containing protein n=1 Tax=Cinchona calisaya TaxID=153742 RepID=A0ABD2YEF8_9GENT
MKIQCDVCNKGEASVYCVADEAALCNSCDHRVHHANKLASKHQRFSLLHPPPKQAPLCDICLERRAFLFCQQDRAILCRECDVPIHKANEHTQKHNRFLLTGVKLSADSALYSSSSNEESAISANGSDAVPNFNPQNTVNKPVSVTPTNISQNPNLRITTSAISDTVTSAAQQPAATSSIAEYLTEMLPGWHVEDFLDNCSSSPSGLCKSTNDIVAIPLWDDGLQSHLSSFLPESNSLWVRQAAPTVHVNPTQTQWFSTSNMGFNFGGQIGSKEMVSNIKSSGRKWTSDDNSFAVPQISPPLSTSFKRLKTTLW